MLHASNVGLNACKVSLANQTYYVITKPSWEACLEN